VILFSSGIRSHAASFAKQLWACCEFSDSLFRNSPNSNQTKNPGVVTFSEVLELQAASGQFLEQVTPCLHPRG